MKKSIRRRLKARARCPSGQPVVDAWFALRGADVAEAEPVALEMMRAAREPAHRRASWILTVAALGVEPARDIFARAVETHAAGSVMTLSGKRPRTLGGVFFVLAKDRVPVSGCERIARTVAARLRLASMSVSGS